MPSVEVNKDSLGAFKPTSHPVIYEPTLTDIKRYVDTMGLDKAVELLQLREDKIAAEATDPYRHGYEGFHFAAATLLLKDNDELLVSGGNRAGKTEWAAKRVACVLTAKKNARVWCVHTTHSSSVQMQQPVVYKYLPAEYKLAKKTKVTNVSFTVKNGFSDNSFVLPNGSQCVFYNTAQERKVVEGGEPDMVWCDELVPLDWLETLRYRLVTRRGKMIVTFTPIHGYTSVVKDYLAGASIKEWKEAPLLGKGINVPGGKPGMMPYIAKCWRPGAAAIWFHSEFNKYSPYDQLVKTLEGRSKHEQKIRAFGWAESLSGSQFPKFSDVNIVEPADIPAGTNYMAMDPAGARNWFMLWLRVDALGRKFIYREWPDADVGEWALPADKLDGKVGLGQRNGAGRGIEDYQVLVKELEAGEKIETRYIDPRAGATQAVGKEGGTSLIDLLQDGDGALWVEPAAGLRVEEGVGLINDWLSWDHGQPRTTVNEPSLYVSSRCQNLIYSMREWTGVDGDKGASKDPIDVLRYLAVMNPEFVDGKRAVSKKAGSY